jgi:hypothetical protein
MAIQENSVKIVKGGSITGDEKSTTANLPAEDEYITYGGDSDLWGETWSASDINDSDFGVGFSVKGSSDVSHYLKATNFGFSIPEGATIDGIKVEIEQSYWTGPLHSAGGNVDHIRITVYYTEGAAGTNTQINIGDAWKDISAMKINIGDAWKDVAGAQINIGDAWKEIF